MTENKDVRPLRCPHCGGGLWINVETVGPAYLTYESPEAIECDQTDCGAVWEPNGDTRTGPRWVEWPDLYDPPARVIPPGVASDE